MKTNGERHEEKTDERSAEKHEETRGHKSEETREDNIVEENFFVSRSDCFSRTTPLMRAWVQSLLRDRTECNAYDLPAI